MPSDKELNGKLDIYGNLDNVSAEVATNILLEGLENELRNTQRLLLEACLTLSRLKYERSR